MNNSRLYIGMDLGTFKTSTVASNGNRLEMQSAVGWPRDYVARKSIGHDVVFGDETELQSTSLDVVRPFESGVLKYVNADEAGMSDDDVQRCKNAAKLLVQNAVSRMCPPENTQILGVIGAPSRATRVNKQFLIEATQDALDAALIVPEPFAVAYGMGRLAGTLVIDVGAGTVDICPMYGAFPQEEDQVTVPMGGDLVDTRLVEILREKHPNVRVTTQMARQLKEKYGFVDETDERVEVTLPVDGRPCQLDVTAELKEACTLLVAPIIAGVEQVLGHIDPSQTRMMLDNVLLAGGGSQLRGLDRLIERSLDVFGGGNVVRAGDSVYAGAAGALTLAMDMPEDHWHTIHSLETEAKAA